MTSEPGASGEPAAADRALGAPPASAGLSKDQSLTIKVARVLCIFFMMSTHGWPGSGRILDADVAPALHLFYVVFVDMLGRAAVPLLSVISGILFVQTFERRSPGAIVSNKVKTLLVPMVVWSLPMIAIGVAKSRLTSEPSPFDGTTIDLVNLLIPITNGPANGALHFLRDVFLMVPYAIVILLLFRRSAVLGTLAALAAFLVEQIPGGFLLFRNQIATMFIFGLLLARFGHACWRPGWPLVAVLMAIYLGTRLAGVLETSPENHLAFRISEHVPRVAMAFLIWRISFEIARRPNRFRSLCEYVEPHIFTVFCLHAIIASFVGGAALVLGLHEEAPYYPLLFAAQLILFVVAGVIASKLLTPFPWLRGRASGGPRQVSAAPPAPLPANGDKPALS